MELVDLNIWKLLFLVDGRSFALAGNDAVLSSLDSCRCLPLLHQNRIE